MSKHVLVTSIDLASVLQVGRAVWSCSIGGLYVFDYGLATNTELAAVINSAPLPALLHLPTVANVRARAFSHPRCNEHA